MDVFEDLITSSSSHSVNPETLEYIGQRASNDFVEKKASLNQAIVKLASQHPELNNEHIHRIAEFANNITFQHLFQQNQDKNVHFDVADPGTIIRDLRDGGSPAHSGKVLHNKSDYYRAPIQEKDGELSDGFADLMNRENSSGDFGQGEPIEKVASAGLDPTWEGSANPINDIYAEHLKLRRAHEELTVSYETADLMYKQASEELYRQAKQEVISANGAGINGVATVFQKLAGNKVAEQEISPLVERLMGDGVPGEVLVAQLQKTAGKIINMEHPLSKVVAGVIKCAQERDVAYGALGELEKGIEKTAAFLKQASRK